MLRIALLASALLFAVQARATVVGIDIQPGSSPGTTAAFTAPYPFESTGNTILPNAYNDNTLWVWDEAQNVTLPSPLAVDWVADPSASYVSPGSGGTYLIQAGTVVSSHYVQWDPAGTGTVVATLHFDSPIFGYIASDQFLFDSDALLGRPGVNYNNFLYRGIEPSTDQVTVGADPRNVDINWYASAPGDWVRLITAFSPAAAAVPEPSTASLIVMAGLLALFSLRGAAATPASPNGRRS